MCETKVSGSTIFQQLGHHTGIYAEVETGMYLFPKNVCSGQAPVTAGTNMERAQHLLLAWSSEIIAYNHLIFFKVQQNGSGLPHLRLHTP
jgi:hypothetical protein